MSNGHDFSAVIFDMDGLLLDTERLAQDIWCRVLEENGYEVRLHVIQQIIGRTAEDSLIIFKDSYGADFPYGELKVRRIELVNQHIQNHGLQAKKGAVELLEYLQRRDIPRIVATSSVTDTAWHHLGAAGIGKYFEHVLGGDKVQNGKPDPEVFLKAAEMLGVPASECVVVEDSAAGIKAAKAGGMLPILVPDIQPVQTKTKAEAFVVCESLLEVVSVIAELAAAQEHQQS